MDKKIIKISNILTQFLKSHPQYINYDPIRFNTWVSFPDGFSKEWLKYINDIETNKKKIIKLPLN